MREFLERVEAVRSWKCQGKCLCSAGFLWTLWTLWTGKQSCRGIRAGSVSSRCPSSPWVWSYLFAASPTAGKRWHTLKSFDCMWQCSLSGCSPSYPGWSSHFWRPCSRSSGRTWRPPEARTSIAVWIDFDSHWSTYLDEFGSWSALRTRPRLGTQWPWFHRAKYLSFSRCFGEDLPVREISLAASSWSSWFRLFESDRGSVIVYLAYVN